MQVTGSQQVGLFALNNSIRPSGYLCLSVSLNDDDVS